MIRASSALSARVTRRITFRIARLMTRRSLGAGTTRGAGSSESIVWTAGSSIVRRPVDRPAASAGRSEVIKVSVVVPVYNPGRNIDECISSLLGQSLILGVRADLRRRRFHRRHARPARPAGGGASARSGRAHPELRLARPSAKPRDGHGARRFRLFRRQRRLDRHRGAGAPPCGRAAQTRRT